MFKFGATVGLCLLAAAVPDASAQGRPDPARAVAAQNALPVPDEVSTLPTHTSPAGLEAVLTTWDYGEVAEVLHIGPYDREEPTLRRLRDFVEAEGYALVGDHEEEYIRGPTMSGPGDPEQYLTILRYRVEKQ